MNPEYPLFIPSKGRWESRLTAKHLMKMNVPFRMVVEPQEYDNYAAVVGEKRLLVLDMSYKDRYDACDGHGMTKSKGSGPARNFIWDTAQKEGYAWHWIMDDNIRGFYYLNNNLKVPAGDGTIFRCMEHFVKQYQNISMAGPHYEMFVPRKVKVKPFILNTRIYSCNLIRTDVPYRWRGRYNEDTILSIDMLKDGWCTVLFNAFLQDKQTTQTMKGGNTDDVYKDGTFDKSKMLEDLFPDIAKVVWRFNRVHHYVNYKKAFSENRLIKKDDKPVKKFALRMIRK